MSQFLSSSKLKIFGIFVVFALALTLFLTGVFAETPLPCTCEKIANYPGLDPVYNSFYRCVCADGACDTPAEKACVKNAIKNYGKSGGNDDKKETTLSGKKCDWKKVNYAFKTGGMEVAISGDGKKLVTVSSFNLIHSSPDDGVTWTELFNTGNNTIRDIISSTDGRKLIANAMDYVYASSDGGNTWSMISFELGRDFFRIAGSDDLKKLAAINDKGFIFTSKDGGVTWKSRQLAGKRWNDITSSADGNKLAINDFYGGYIYTSVDGGDTWKESLSAGKNAFFAITSSADGTKLAICGNERSVYTSEDSGATWKERTNFGKRTCTRIKSSDDGKTIVALSYGGYLYVSNDSGATWEPQSVPGLKSWWSISSSADGKKIVAGNVEGQVWVYSCVEEKEQPCRGTLPENSAWHVDNWWSGHGSLFANYQKPNNLTEDCDFICKEGYNWEADPISPPEGTPITECLDLYKIANDLKGKYYLANDIYCTGRYFHRIGDTLNPFFGILDGRNRTIYDYTNNDSGYNGNIASMFMSIGKGAEIKNIHFENILVESNGFFGALAYYNSGTISNVSMTGKLVIDLTNNPDVCSYAGALVASNSGVIRNSYTDLDFDIIWSGPKWCSKLGMIAGDNIGLIENVYSHGAFSGTGHFGGIVGENGGTLKNSYSDVTGSRGGIAIWNYSVIENCYWIANPDKCVYSTSGTPPKSCTKLNYGEMIGNKNIYYKNNTWDFNDIWELRSAQNPDLRRMKYVSSGKCVKDDIIVSEPCQGILPTNAVWWETLDTTYPDWDGKNSKTAIWQEKNNTPEVTTCDFKCVDGYRWEAGEEVMAGEFVGWGQNNFGQANSPGGDEFVEITGNGFHTIALDKNGKIFGWGNNDENGTGNQTAILDGIPDGDNYIVVSSDWYHAYALDQDGIIHAWGLDYSVGPRGAKGKYIGQVSDAPKDSGYVDVQAGAANGVALHKTGRVECWGAEYACNNAPVDSNYTAIAVGDNHAYALREDGTIYAWGGNGTEVTDIPTDSGYVAIAAGDHFGLALDKDGFIRAWGYNNYSQSSEAPKDGGYNKIYAGGETGYAIKNGIIYAWGKDNEGEVSGIPTDIGYTDIKAGDLHAFAIKGKTKVNKLGSCVKIPEMDAENVCQGTLPANADWWYSPPAPPKWVKGSSFARYADYLEAPNQSCGFYCQDGYEWQENKYTPKTGDIAIHNCGELQAIKATEAKVLADWLSARKLDKEAKKVKNIYYLANDIDCSETRTWNFSRAKTRGFLPISPSDIIGYGFAGVLLGNCHTIKDLYIDCSGNFSDTYCEVAGLIGHNEGDLKNIILENVEIYGADDGSVGGIIGSNGGSIQDSIVSGKVKGVNNVGGLVGLNGRAIFRNWADVAVTGSSSLGGLVGLNSGQIERSYAIGKVTGKENVGGLIGYNDKGPQFTYKLSDSYATGAVSGTKNIGGLIGTQRDGSVDRSFATGPVTGTENVGGLIGFYGASDTSSLANESFSVENSSYFAIDTAGLRNCYGKVEDSRKNQFFCQPIMSHIDFYNKGKYMFVGWDSIDRYWQFSGRSYPTLVRNFCGSCVKSTEIIPIVRGTTKCRGTIPAGASWYDRLAPPLWKLGYIWPNFQASDIRPESCDFECKDGYVWKENYGTPISTCVELRDNINANLAGTFYLTKDINCFLTRIWNFKDGKWLGWTPVAQPATGKIFTGTLYGNCHKISNLYINRPNEDYVGLFGMLHGTVKNLQLVDAVIVGRDRTGTLAGYASGATIEGVSVGGGSTAGVSGASSVGLLVGSDMHTVTIGSYVQGKLTGVNNVGALSGDSLASVITNSYSSATVIGDNQVGGLVGRAMLGYIDNSYSSGSIQANDRAGGLVGNAIRESMENTFASVTVIGTSTGSIGGLVGNSLKSKLTNNYWANDLHTTPDCINIMSNTAVTECIGTSSAKFRERNRLRYNLPKLVWDLDYVWKQDVDAYPILRASTNCSNGTCIVKTKCQDSPPANATWWDDDWWYGKGLEKANHKDPNDLNEDCDFHCIPGYTWKGEGRKLGTPIKTCEDLQTLIDLKPTGTFYLDGPNGVIDCSATRAKTSLWKDGLGFNPIGQISSENYTNAFSGTLYGNCQTIKNLYIARPISDRIGLFSFINGGSVYNLRMEGFDITGKGVVGALGGMNYGIRTADGSFDPESKVARGQIENIFLSGSVLGTYNDFNAPETNYVGAMFGYAVGSEIENCEITADIRANATVGGVIGRLNFGNINKCRTSGIITNVAGGGLVGFLGGYIKNYNPPLVASLTLSGGSPDVSQGIVKNSYSLMKIKGGRIGGLIGVNRQGTLENSYFAGELSYSGTDQGTIGGLANENDGLIRNSFSAGKLSAPDPKMLAGIAWDNTLRGSIVSSSWASDNVDECFRLNDGNADCSKKPLENFYSHTNSPLNTWDWSVWQEQANALPIFQGSISNCGKCVPKSGDGDGEPDTDTPDYPGTIITTRPPLVGISTSETTIGDFTLPAGIPLITLDRPLTTQETQAVENAIYTIAVTNSVPSPSLASRLDGRVLLNVDDSTAWYVTNGFRFYINARNGYEFLQAFGVGATESYLMKSPLGYNAVAMSGLPDADGDGLPDAVEPIRGLDPLNPDTDGDRYLDGIEVANGFDPAGPQILSPNLYLANGIYLAVSGANAHGEAFLALGGLLYYVSPANIYPTFANLALGITSTDLAQIPVGAVAGK